MEKFDKLRAQYNCIHSFTQIEKHKNFNNIHKYGDKCFEISNQRAPTEQEVLKANKMRHIEGPNLYLKQIQNKNKRATIKTTFNNLKQQINAVIEQAYSNHVQLTSYVVRFFQQFISSVSQ
ncbi:Hypothetical_protein [Hexamita inflata]|uniref:Hypothetical_protein n=1 Tax=Hexamita inflata TaxID=28002 RepID=A0AA86QX67_9EUKA|nr:Hypothetical protein HINF_LOCUS50546 [Hexamita inflata]